MSNVPEQSKHTPTPWKFDEAFNCANEKKSFVNFYSDTHGHIGNMVGGYPADISVLNANAAFIVEACNNYEALQSQNAELVKALERAEEEITADKGGRVWTCLQVIRAALSKAHP